MLYAAIRVKANVEQPTITDENGDKLKKNEKKMKTKENRKRRKRKHLHKLDYNYNFERIHSRSIPWSVGFVDIIFCRHFKEDLMLFVFWSGATNSKS